MNHLHRQPIRIRHQLKRRLLKVARVEQVSPHMKRIVVTGDDLAGFESAAADDHVKLFFPERGRENEIPELPPEGSRGGEGGGARRDYTPLHYDASTNELTLEFVIHAHGPASEWAAQATPGQYIMVGGPRGSMLIPEDYAAYVLVGDETALPAITRRLREARPGMRFHALIEVADAAEERALPTGAEAQITWVHRDGREAGTTTLLDEAIAAALPAERDVHIWIGCEIETARRLRTHLVEALGYDREQIKAAGYWRRGAADAGGKIED